MAELGNYPNNINPVTSQGLYGLPHFRSSRVSTAMWEPVYTTLYTVDIVLPDAVTANIGAGDKDLLLEGITRVDGLDTNVVPAAGATQNYKMSQRRYANAGPDKTTLDIKFDIEINVRGSVDGHPDMYTLKILRKWNDLVWDPLTGRTALKAEYVAPYVLVTVHDKAYQPFWQWKLYHVWPSANLTTPTFDYTNKSSLYKVTGYTLACDYWDEYML